MRTIMVTGGAGFMGSHFVKKLMAECPDDRIVVVDKLTYAGNVRNLPSGFLFPVSTRYASSWESSRLSFFRVDIGDNLMDWVFDGHSPVDVVVNFAAETHVDRSIREPEAFLQTDVMGLFNLVRLSKEFGVRKFIHISTDEVYGPISVQTLVNCWEVYDEASETWALNPTSPYSASKACADLLLLSYYKTYGFPVIIIRPCNNYGSNQYPEKLVPMAITRLLQGKKVLMHGEGKEVREWLYVEDCVSALYEVMNSGIVGEVYNLGSGFRLNNKRVVQDILLFTLFPRGYCIAHDEEDLLFEEWVDQVPNRPGNDSRYAIDSTKLVQGVMGMEGKYFEGEGFDFGIQKTIQWYRENEWFWSNVNLDANLYREGNGYMR